MKASASHKSWLYDESFYQMQKENEERRVWNLYVDQYYTWVDQLFRAREIHERKVKQWEAVKQKLADVTKQSENATTEIQKAKEEFENVEKQWKLENDAWLNLNAQLKAVKPIYLQKKSALIAPIESEKLALQEEVRQLRSDKEKNKKDHADEEQNLVRETESLQQALDATAKWHQAERDLFIVEDAAHVRQTESLIETKSHFTKKLNTANQEWDIKIREHERNKDPTYRNIMIENFMKEQGQFF